MKAIKIGQGHTATIEEVPIPKLEDNRVLVKITAVAINPTDWKAIHTRDVPGARSGCDYVGVVQEVGSKVGKTYSVGDRIAGLIKGALVNSFLFFFSSSSTVLAFQHYSAFSQNHAW